MLTVIRKTHLPVALTAIHLGEKFVPLHSIYDLFHIWHWFCIEFCHFVKSPEINAEPYRTSFFGTRTIGDDYGEADFSITPSSSIFLISESMTSRALNGTGYPFDRIGSDVNNLISC